MFMLCYCADMRVQCRKGAFRSIPHFPGDFLITTSSRYLWTKSTTSGSEILRVGGQYVIMTRCQILCSMRLQCVCKILTPRRMLKKSSLVAKINGWNNSFQNRYVMLWVKVDRFARKTIRVPLKSLGYNGLN